MEKLKLLNGFVIEAKDAYAKGDLKTASEYWTKIYNACESNNMDDFKALALAMRPFTDQEVYDITDFLKREFGYYG